MADKTMTPPPAGMGGAGGLGKAARRGRPVEKPRDMKGTLRRLWELTKGHRQGLGWILPLSGLASASAIFSPLIIGRAVTAVDGGGVAEGILLILLAVYFCDWLVRFLQQFFMAAISQRIIHHIRITLFGAIEKLPLSFFDRRQHGELMSRLTNDADNISATISNSLAQLFTFAFTIAGIFCIMLRLSGLLAAVSLTSVGFVFALARIITHRTRKLYARQQKALGRMNGQVEESVSGAAVVKAFCREERMIQEFDENNEALRQIATKALIWSGFLMPITNVINNLGFVAISVASGLMAARGLISIGMITSFLLYIRRFSRPFVDIANIYNNFQTAVAGAERIFEILDQPPEEEDGPDALPLAALRGDIELRHVSFGYTEEGLVLQDVSLKIPAGTRVAIAGPTGAGKTTIINLLVRFYDVTEGQILLDARDLREYRREELRRSFGVVLQDTALFAQTIKENIAYGRKTASMEEIQEAARRAGADAFIRRLPKGYDTTLVQGGAELSQGERQLLAIARAMLADAPILILDEATSSVDTVTEQKIRQAVLAMTQGRTSFIIAHRLATIRDSDVILFIEAGRIAEMGTHEELLERNGRYASMYRIQMGE